MDKKAEREDQDQELAKKIPSENQRTRETWRWLEAIGDCV